MSNMIETFEKERAFYKKTIGNMNDELATTSAALQHTKSELTTAQSELQKLTAENVEKSLVEGKHSMPPEYAIDVMLPSTYNDAQILIDGAPARITSRTPSFVTLLASQQDAPHKLQIVKNSTVIREETFLATTNHPVIKPFQY